MSRVFGLARDVLLALVLGVGAQADAFVIAFRLPNLFRRLFAEGAFAAGFIPVYSSMREEERKHFAAVVLSFISLFLLGLTIIAEIFMEELVFLLAGGFDVSSDKFALAVLCARITFPYLVFMFLTALYATLLNVGGRFLASSTTPILLNIALIIACLTLWQFNQSENAAFYLSLAIIIAGIAQVAMIIFAAARANLLVLPKKITITQKLKEFFNLLLPALAAGGVVQLNIIIGTRIASSQESAVAQLYYAERLYQLPLAIIGIALSLALLPALAAQIENKTQVQNALARAMEGAMLLTLPAAAALAIIAEPIIAALFEYGAFNETARINTALILAAFALGLPAFVAQKILSAACFAHHDTKTPLYFSALALVVNVCLALLWFPLWGAAAIALATSLAAWANALGLWFVAARQKWIVTKPLYKTFLAQAAVSALMAGALFAIQSFYPLPELYLIRIFYLVALVLIGLVIYSFICHIVKLVNVKEIKKEFI